MDNKILCLIVIKFLLNIKKFTYYLIEQGTTTGGGIFGTNNNTGVLNLTNQAPQI